jgi:hypothetical protein
LESLEFKKIDVGLTKFKNDKILLYEISHRFLLTTKLFTGWKSLIKTSLVTLAPLFCGVRRDNKVEWDLMASKTFTPFNFNYNSCLLYLFLRTFLLPLRRITLQILFKHRLTCQWLVQLIFFDLKLHFWQNKLECLTFGAFEDSSTGTQTHLTHTHKCWTRLNLNFLLIITVRNFGWILNYYLITI